MFSKPARCCSCREPLIYELDGVFRPLNGFTIDEQRRVQECVCECSTKSQFHDAVADAARVME
jgi:hypothetical protein